MKVIYLDDTKRMPEFTEYNQLVNQCLTAFKFENTVELGENVKFFYMDNDGDIISITSQGDLEEARQVMPQLKLVICKNNEEAK